MSETTFITSDDTVICANLLTPQAPRLTPTGKISHAKTRVYTQRYRKEWEQMPDFKGWLTSVPYQQTRAYCTYCKKNLHAHRLSLLKHTCTMKHQRAALAHEVEKDNPESTQGENSEMEIEFVEVETMDNQTEEGEEGEEGEEDEEGEEGEGEGEENEEEIEYIVEKLDTDEEEEDAKEIDTDLCAQLESDDETSKPIIKKIKLDAQDRCQDTLAKAMAHVHSEYLDEEVEDQENVQMEMVVAESGNTETVSIQPDSADDIKEPSSEKRNNSKILSHSENQLEKKSLGKILQEDDKNVLIACPLPVVGTNYQIDSSNKTITLTSGGKTLALTGGTFQPGTQYVLKKIKAKLPTLVTDKKSTAVVNQNNSEVINVTRTSQASTSQQSSKKSTKIVQKGLRISTHVIDITKGLPVCGLQVSLYKLLDGRWTFLNESTTNPTGRCIDLIDKIKLNCIAGRYKIHFDVDKYFTLRRIETMYPFIEIVFDVKNPTGQYHIPILLSPFGYSTFRDSR